MPCLKDCPFCKGTPRLTEEKTPLFGDETVVRHVVRISCQKCTAMMWDGFDSYDFEADKEVAEKLKNRLIREWNRRVAKCQIPKECLPCCSNPSPRRKKKSSGQ